MMKQETIPFTPYQKFMIAILALLQFTVILDFMVISPLGDMLMKSLSITPSRFGFVVSAYAFSAGISGILAAGFADKFDRKKLLLFFYTGFVAGTFFCSVANTYHLLLAARIVTGLFGGVIGSISLAILADLFVIDQRGRAMSFIQMAFAGSQVLGIPIGLYISNIWGWHAPFLMIVIFAAIIGILIVVKMKPITAHLALQSDKSPFLHIWHTVQKKQYRIGFIATALMSIGGFMLMPFGSAFLVNNVLIEQKDLLWIYMVTGISSMVIMPVIGKLSDKIDKFTVFAFGSVWAILMIIAYTNLPAVPLWVVMVVNVLMFMGIMSRMIPSTALVSAVPEMQDRGAFMSINSSLQQMAGGVASVLAGMIVVQETKHSPLQHYDILGYIAAAVIALCIFFVFRVSKIVKHKFNKKPSVTSKPETVDTIFEG